MATEITGKSGDVSVGEKIRLGVKYTKNWGILKSVEWKIPGTVVKGYTWNQTKAEVKHLVEADKKNATVEFHWVDGADGRKVEAKCVFTSAGKDKKKTLSATFNVKAPKLQKFAAKTDSVRLTPRRAPTHMGFGSRKAGIKWNWKVKVPGTSDGFVKDVQTLEDVTKRTTTAGTKQVWTIAGTKVPPTHVQLDTDNPYSLPGDFHATKGFPTKVSAGRSYRDNYTSDSPRTPLGGTTRKFVHDKFKYYIMYRPDVAGAIWVPVAKAEWYWKAEAKLAGGKWSATTKEGGVTAAGAETSEFPEYRSNVKFNSWQTE